MIESGVDELRLLRRRNVVRQTTYREVVRQGVVHVEDLHDDAHTPFEIFVDGHGRRGGFPHGDVIGEFAVLVAVSHAHQAGR